MYPSYDSYEIHTLEQVKLVAQAAISRNMLGLAVEPEVFVSHVTNSLMLRLRALVYEDPRARSEEEHVFEEQVTHPTWRHALIASLPEAALFRRRFLGYLFDIDPMWGGRRIVHTFTVKRRGVFPNTKYRYPENLGTIQYVTETQHQTRAEF